MGNSSLPTSTGPRGDEALVDNRENQVPEGDDVAKFRATIIRAANAGHLDGLLTWLPDLIPLLPSQGRVTSSSVQQTTRSGTERDRSSGKRSNPKDTLADGLYHLGYIVKGFLETQRNDPNLKLESGVFPRKMSWFGLFEAGLKAEEKKGFGGLRPPGREPLDGIAAYNPGDMEEHKAIVEKLRRVREESKQTIVALCQKADPSSTAVPWKSLLPAQPPVEPERRHHYNTAASIVVYGPRSYINCDCEEGRCKFQEASDDQAFKVAFGVAWCAGRNCLCAGGKQKVKILGFMSCSWTSPMGVRLVDVPTVTIPEDGVPSCGIECEWPEALIDNRTEFDNKPDGRSGPWSDEKKQKANETRARNKALKEAGLLTQTDASIRGIPDVIAQQAAQEQTKRKNRQKRKNHQKRLKGSSADSVPGPTRMSKRSTKGQAGSQFIDYETGRDATRDGETQDTDVSDQY